MLRSFLGSIGIVGLLLPVAVSAVALEESWPSWIGRIEWLWTEPVSAPQDEPAVPDALPSSSVYYDRVTGRLVHDEEPLPPRIVVTGKEVPAGWPDWIGVPEWYR